MSDVAISGDLSKALDEMAAKLKSANAVKIGFLESASYPDGTPVAMIAAIQNYGAPSRGIPPRPFFTNMVRDKQSEWGPALAKMLADGMDAATALETLGEGIEGQLKQSIIDTIAPPNSPVTNLLKERFPMGGQTFKDVLEARRDVAAGVTAPAGKPLVQSGVLLASTGHEVE